MEHFLPAVFAQALVALLGFVVFPKLYRFYRNVFRTFSRSLLRDYTISGPGIEIGVGNQSIAPQGTLLTDVASSYASGNSIATAIFPGHQIPFPDGHFSYVLSEHVLEHVRDPIEMLKEWRRVLTPGGRLFLFLPHPRRTFDRFRKPTTLNHLWMDHGGKDSDPEHILDWNLRVKHEGLAPHYAKFTDEELLRDNHLHRHVLMPDVMMSLLRELGFTILFDMGEVPDRKDSYVIVAERG